MLAVRRAVAVAAVSAALLAGGCRPAPDAPGAPLRPQWQELPLPLPAGPPGRILLRDLVGCAGRWFLVGAVAGGDGSTRPAAWSSTDGTAWAPLAVVGTSYYGRKNVLYAAGCRDGRVAAVGARGGGAHGNPRVSTWTQAGERLVEVSAPFERYGGPEAVNVGRLAGGPAGWLIVGNRSGGAAVWVSADSTSFDLVDNAPQLADDERGRTLAFDVAATGRGWLAVGSVRHTGRTEPLAWSSDDGRTWRRAAVPAVGEYAELRRVALVGDAPLAVGVRGGGFGAWRDDGRGWAAVSRFGATGGSGPAGVRGLAVAGDQVVAAVSTGAVHQLWISGDRGRTWREVSGPRVAVAADGASAMTVTAVGGRVVVAADDGGRAGLWVSDVAGPGG